MVSFWSLSMVFLCLWWGFMKIFSFETFYYWVKWYIRSLSKNSISVLVRTERSDSLFKFHGFWSQERWVSNDACENMWKLIFFLKIKFQHYLIISFFLFILFNIYQCSYQKYIIFISLTFNSKYGPKSHYNYFQKQLTFLPSISEIKHFEIGL